MERLKRHAPRWPGSLRHRLERQHSQKRARSQGQALVEFALIAPLFLVLIFGVVEFALINASIGAFNFAAKEGARYEAIIGNGAPVVATPPAPPLDQWVVNDVILPHVTGVVMAQMNEVIVYRADETGNCFSGGPPPCSVSPTYEDILQNVSGTWQTTSNTWTINRNTQLSNADYVGVYISYTYTYLTAFFAVTTPTVGLSATSVQRIEPQQYGYHKHDAQIADVGARGAWARLPSSNPLAMLFGAAAILPRRNQSFLAGEYA